MAVRSRHSPEPLDLAGLNGARDGRSDVLQRSLARRISASVDGACVVRSNVTLPFSAERM